MSDRPTQFDLYSQTYVDEVNRSVAFTGLDVDYFTGIKTNYLLDLIAGHFGSTSSTSLLDIGCGIGNSHRMLRTRLGHIAGVDLSSECLAAAQVRNPGVTYRHYDGGRLPFGDEEFDTAATICVMHHVPPAQRASFVAEMKRVIRRGGLAVVFEHNPLNPLTQKAVSKCEFDADAVLLPSHELRELLTAAKFVQLQCRSILSIPSVGPKSRQIDLFLGRLGLGAQYYVSAVA